VKGGQMTKLKIRDVKGRRFSQEEEEEEEDYSRLYGISHQRLFATSSQ
jgi:hypothetical protein